MVKKVALVDYDETLVVEGELNLAVIADLVDKDPVIIFSQREANTIQIQVNKKSLIEGLDLYEAMDALKHQYPDKTILFSSSHDQFCKSDDGAPLPVGNYYEKILKPYEQLCIDARDLNKQQAELNDMFREASRRINAPLREGDSDDERLQNAAMLGAKLNDLNRQLDEINQKIKYYKDEQFKQVHAVVGQEFKEEGKLLAGVIDGRKVELDKDLLVATGKATQFVHLHKHLQNEYKNEPLDYTWYEDTQQNITEMGEALQQEIVPNFKVVKIGVDGSLSPAKKLPDLLDECSAFQEITNTLSRSTAFSWWHDVHSSDSESKLATSSINSENLNDNNQDRLLLAIEQAKNPHDLVSFLSNPNTVKEFPEFKKEIEQLAEEIGRKVEEQQQAPEQAENYRAIMDSFKGAFSGLREEREKINADIDEKHEALTDYGKKKP